MTAKEETPKLNLHQKLVEIRKNIGGFTKDTQGYGYKYVSGSQVLAKIQETMNELGVLLIPQIKSQQFEKHEYKNQKGKDSLDFLVYGEMTYTWVNAENPDDKLEVPFYYTGAQDDISKAFGSGLTYSERYFVIKFFNLPTDADDPDKRDTSGRSGNGYRNQQQQQAPQYQQPYQQQPYPQAPPQQTQNPNEIGSVTPPQIKAINAKLANCADGDKEQMAVIYNGAINNLGIPDGTQRKDLSKAQATKLIDYLKSIEPATA